MTDLRLYDYAASGNCYKARLLLAQLGRSYERVPVDIFAGETLTDEFERINPARTTPVLETEDGYLSESNAILVYLAAGTPLLPDDPFELAQVVRWLIYEQTDVTPIRNLRFVLLVGRLASDDPRRPRAGRTQTRCYAGSMIISPRGSSSSGIATRSRTSRSTATRTSRTRPESTWSNTRTFAPGSPVSSSSPATSRTSSPTVQAPPPEPAASLYG